MTHSTRSSTKFAGMLAIAATVAMPVLAVPALAQTAPKPAAPAAAPMTPPAKTPMGATGTTTPMGATGTTTMSTKMAPADHLRMKDRDRASKIIGSDVMNDKKETIGTVEDLIITQDEKVPTAVLSVGGFLGIGTKYVAVPFSDLKITNDGMMMAGATKASLKAKPAYKFENK